MQVTERKELGLPSFGEVKSEVDDSSGDFDREMEDDVILKLVTQELDRAQKMDLTEAE